MTHAIAGSWLFLGDADYELRLGQFADAVRRDEMRVHAYCLMGNHEHLLVSVDNDRLSKLMYRLNRAYAYHFNRTYGRRGRVYRERFRSVPVVSERHLAVLISYLALNPEKASFPRAEAYRWSSYPSLVGIVETPSFLDHSPLIDVVGGGTKALQLIVELVERARPFARAAGPGPPVPRPGPRQVG